MGAFLFLLGVMVTGAALSYGATDTRLYGIGRSLSFFSASFIPVAFYMIYRQYTVGPARRVVIGLLSVIPLATTVLALTNPMHGMIWAAFDTPDGPVFTPVTAHWWFTKVHAPFAYGLFGFALVALAGRLSSIAPAHRAQVVMLLVCAALPFASSIANTFLGIGPIDFPVLASTLVLLLPVYAYISLGARVFDFSPLAYPMVFDHVRDPILVLDNDQRIVCLNKRARELLGSSERELLGERLWAELPEARDVLRSAREQDLTQTLRLGTDRTYEVSVAPLADGRGQVQGSVVVCRDVTERRAVLAQIEENEHQIRTLIETSSNGILRFSRNASNATPGFRCVYANRAAEACLRGETGTLVGASLEDLRQLDPGRLLKHFGRQQATVQPLSFEIEAWAADDDGWFRLVAEPVGDDFSVTLIDITQRKRNEDKMLADALHDPLTGVLNRRGFEKSATEAIQQNETAAVLYLDLNRFKSINDRFGHSAGDALLKAFGHRLDYCLRSGGIIGRLGGDEFCVVLPGVTVEDAKRIAERLVAAASELYIIEGQEIRCAASVGIALKPRHGEELWHLISVADQAMYNAKAMGDAAANDRATYVEASLAS
jgi:diguanylate cyclase (GGDEF)-like protein/PAS domain S-box-containing protein